MGDDDVAALQLDRQIFGAARERDDTPAGDCVLEILGKGKAQIGTAQFGAHEKCSLHRRRQSALDRFHLGQFRHRLTSFNPLFIALARVSVSPFP